MTEPVIRQRSRPEMLRFIAADLIRLHDELAQTPPGTPRAHILRTHLLGHAIAIDSMAGELDHQDTE